MIGLKLIAFKIYVHREDDINSVWSFYYDGINPPSTVIKGENQQVTPTENKCFAYNCKFSNLHDRAIKFTDTVGYSILLCENVYSQGPGTISISSSSKNDIIIDKFCSFESQAPSDGQFAFFEGKINSTIIQGSICNGGNSSVSKMIHKFEGIGSLSKTNVSNCISLWMPSFYFDTLDSTINISFCNFENLKATERTISAIWGCPGTIERSNYINNSQELYGYLVSASHSRLKILDSSFQNNLRNNEGVIFYGYFEKIYIRRCSIDNFSYSGKVDTSELGESSFKIIFKFNDFPLCETDFEYLVLFEPKKEKPKFFQFGKYYISVLLIS